MAVLPRLEDEHLSAEAATVFADIRASRGSDFVNDFWRVLAHDPDLLKATWERLKAVMAPREGGLDPLTKELVYLAVSTANGCSYCVHSHTAAARAKGLTEAQHGEFLAVVAMAATTNALVDGLQVAPDEVFRRG
ncbi:MAG: carboxymuconolactone decarboxylase family protein [Pikeienuella sp.]|uniref:carboxymuconolactone decarboxylase family protein n=1 Tax=Pikeienuella sp. TaxID=2831957 RepID=UPI0039189EBF